MKINKILTDYLDKLPSNKKYKDLKMIEAIELNEIRNENCLDTMKLMKDNFVDLTVTSPPYEDFKTFLLKRISDLEESNTDLTNRNLVHKEQIEILKGEIRYLNNNKAY